MRRIGLIALATLLGVSASFGEDAVKAIFLPGTSSEPAKVLYTDTNMMAAVIGVLNGQPPVDCPDGSFWTKDQNSLVSCKDGATFRLFPLKPNDKFYDLYSSHNASRLQKIIGGGTDDGGPMTPK